MTTDDTALADLARKINEEGWTCNSGIHEPGEYGSCIACQAVSNEVARVVLPTIRKAERDAAREAVELYQREVVGWQDETDDFLARNYPEEVTP